MCDIKILVDVPYETRKQRAMQRDNITAEQFDLREQASVEYDKEKFDIVVNNNDINEIKKLVKQI
jgi:dephospho-CoA kinase